RHRNRRTLLRDSRQALATIRPAVRSASMTATTTRHTWPRVRPPKPYTWAWQPADPGMWQITVTVTATGQRLSTTYYTHEQPGRAASERIAARLFSLRRN